jgi:hypothetical protein
MLTGEKIGISDREAELIKKYDISSSLIIPSLLGGCAVAVILLAVNLAGKLFFGRGIPFLIFCVWLVTAVVLVSVSFAASKVCAFGMKNNADWFTVCEKADVALAERGSLIRGAGFLTDKDAVNPSGKVFVGRSPYRRIKAQAGLYQMQIRLVARAFDIKTPGRLIAGAVAVLAAAAALIISIMSITAAG